MISTGIVRIIFLSVVGIVLTFSTILMACGIALFFGVSVFNYGERQLAEKVSSDYQQLGVTVKGKDFSSSLSQIMVLLGYCFLSIGLVIFALSSLGCIGATLNIDVILLIYASLNLMTMLTIVALYAKKDSLQGTLKPLAKDSLKTFTGISGNRSETVAWNAVMSYWGCCGVDGHEDFQHLPHWPPKQTEKYDLKIPVMCCKAKTKNLACAKKGNADNSDNWMRTGCYDKVYDDVIYDPRVIAVVILVVLLNGDLMVCALFLAIAPKIGGP